MAICTIPIILVRVCCRFDFASITHLACRDRELHTRLMDIVVQSRRRQPHSRLIRTGRLRPPTDAAPPAVGDFGLALTADPSVARAFAGPIVLALPAGSVSGPAGPVAGPFAGPIVRAMPPAGRVAAGAGAVAGAGATTGTVLAVGPTASTSGAGSVQAAEWCRVSAGQLTLSSGGGQPMQAKSDMRLDRMATPSTLLQ